MTKICQLLYQYCSSEWLTLYWNLMHFSLLCRSVCWNYSFLKPSTVFGANIFSRNTFGFFWIFWITRNDFFSFGLIVFELERYFSSIFIISNGIFGFGMLNLILFIWRSSFNFEQFIWFLLNDCDSASIMDRRSSVRFGLNNGSSIIPSWVFSFWIKCSAIWLEENSRYWAEKTTRCYLYYLAAQTLSLIIF